MKRRRWLTLSIAPRWYLQGFESLPSSQTWEAVLVLPETLELGNIWGRDRQLNYVIFAIRYPLFATHTLKGPLVFEK